MKHMALLTIGLSISVGTPAYAGCTNPGGNLLANCGFATDVAGWTPEGGGSATFTHDAVQGHSILGAAHVGGDTAIGASQCFAVAPGLYGYGMFGNNFAGTGVLVCTVTVQGFSTPACGAGSEVGAALTHNAGFTNGLNWVQMNNTGTLGATVQSARFRIACNAPAVADAYFDDVFFGVGLTPAELVGFSVE